MDSINKLAKYFKEFPGIGERQAVRFVYFLLHKNPEYSKDLIDAIKSIRENIKQCPSCFIFFEDRENNLCENCNNEKLDKSTLLIIEKDSDYKSIKKSKTYNGMYFILGGLVPIVTKENLNFVRTKELYKKIEEGLSLGYLKEIIIALAVNPQGEHTDTYIREILSPLSKKYDFKIVSLGRGLSTGTELEYSDSETIKNALKNRA
jgi:recombination protein RecR